jgi:hypothetical protein
MAYATSVAKPEPSLLYRHYMRGLSDGLIILAVAGFVWLLAAGWGADCRLAGVVPWTTEDVPLHFAPWAFGGGIAGMSVLIALQVKIRRKTKGFRYKLLREPGHEVQRDLARSIQRTFMLVAIAEGGLCWLSAVLGQHFHREDLIWPAANLVVSLHFLPLGKIFAIRPYYVIGVVGSIVSAAVFAIDADAATRLVWLGASMAPVMWVAAAYMLTHSEQLAKGWVEAHTPAHI